MAEKVTVMVLKVDLQCPSCCKKIKKILCKIPQIRGQIYDDKQNTVTIDVICCSPEKIRDKLCCKGGNVIKSIEIKEPKKKPPKKPKEEKPEVPVIEQPGSPTKPVKGPEPVPLYPPARTCCGPCSEGYGGGPCYRGYPSLPPCYDRCYGYGYWYGCGCGCGCGCGRGYQLRKCVCYVEETPSAECKIM